jgi:hypothetical protein
MFIAALLVECPGIRLVCVSTGARAGGKLMKEVLRFLNFAPNNARRRICGYTDEMLFVAARALPPGVSQRSGEAKMMQTEPGTSFLEVLPDNPKGKWVRGSSLSHTHTHARTHMHGRRRRRRRLCCLAAGRGASTRKSVLAPCRPMLE